jgi:hypothetical protein
MRRREARQTKKATLWAAFFRFFLSHHASATANVQAFVELLIQFLLLGIEP